MKKFLFLFGFIALFSLTAFNNESGSKENSSKPFHKVTVSGCSRESIDAARANYNYSIQNRPANSIIISETEPSGHIVWEWNTPHVEWCYSFTYITVAITDETDIQIVNQINAPKRHHKETCFAGDYQTTWTQGQQWLSSNFNDIPYTAFNVEQSSEWLPMQGDGSVSGTCVSITWWTNY